MAGANVQPGRPMPGSSCDRQFQNPDTTAGGRVTRRSAGAVRQVQVRLVRATVERA